MLNQYKNKLGHKESTSNIEETFLLAAKKHLELKKNYNHLSLELEQKTDAYYQMLSLLIRLEMDFEYPDKSNSDMLIKHLSSIQKSGGNDKMTLKEKIHHLKSVMGKKDALFLECNALKVEVKLVEDEIKMCESVLEDLQSTIKKGEEKHSNRRDQKN